MKISWSLSTKETQYFNAWGFFFSCCVMCQMVCFFDVSELKEAMGFKGENKREREKKKIFRERMCCFSGLSVVKTRSQYILWSVLVRHDSKNTRTQKERYWLEDFRKQHVKMSIELTFRQWGMSIMIFDWKQCKSNEVSVRLGQILALNIKVAMNKPDLRCFTLDFGTPRS